METRNGLLINFSLMRNLKVGFKWLSPLYRSVFFPVNYYWAYMVFSTGRFPGIFRRNNDRDVYRRAPVFHNGPARLHGWWLFSWHMDNFFHIVTLYSKYNFFVAWISVNRYLRWNPERSHLLLWKGGQMKLKQVTPYPLKTGMGAFMKYAGTWEMPA